MRVFKKQITDTKTLQELVPLNALSDQRFAEVVDKIVIEEIRSGRYLCRAGDRDNQSIYVLDGKVNLINGRGKVTSEIEAGTDFSRYPVANQQPRTLSARAATRVVIARIDSSLLDAFLTWDHPPGAEVTEINTDSNQDWMTRMLQSEAFERISPAGIQRLLMKMQSLPVQAGEVIVRQGDEGDFFYTIHTGRCIITRKTTADSKDEVLAELSNGDCFGEEALVSENRRNATVTMLTDGILMRLAKKDFVELLQKPLVRYVSYAAASAMVDAGAVWIDVRSEGEYEEGAIEESVNIPLSTLRSEIPELVFNSQYIICCDTGSRSVSAAFILSHKGFEVYVLEGGLNGMSPDELAQASLPSQGDTVAPVRASLALQDDTDVVSFSQHMAAAADDDQPAGLEALRRENQALRRQLDAHRRTDEDSFKQQLKLQSAEEEKQLLRDQQDALRKDYQERINQLQLELKESGDRVQALRSETGDGAQEQHQLQERVESEQASLRLQVEHLEGESIQYAQHVEALQDELQAAHEEINQLQAGAGTQLQQQQALVETLRAELAESRRHSGELNDRIVALQQDKQAAEEGGNAELQTLQEESDRATRQVQALQAELQAAHQQIDQSRSEADSSEQERQRQVEDAQADLARSEQCVHELRQEIDALQQDKQAAEARSNSTLMERGAELEQLDHQLAEARQQNGELGARLDDEQGNVGELQRQLDELGKRDRADLEGLQERNRQLTGALERANAGRQELENRLEAIRSESDTGQERVRQLQEEIVSLQSENQHFQALQQDELGRSGALEAEKQAMLERLQGLQQELESERNSLGEQNTAYEQQIADLGEQLAQAREAARMEQQGLDDRFKEYQQETEARIEQQQHQHEESQQAQDRLAHQLEALTAERNGLVEELSTAQHDVSAGRQEVEQLNEAILSLTEKTGKEIKALNEGLAGERQRIKSAELDAVEQMARAETLQQELERREKTLGELQEQLEATKQQSEEGLQLHQQHEKQLQAIEQEHQEALRQLGVELAGKTDQETELRGQIERLGKKLEQSAEELQRSHAEAKENDERLRNELAEERRARSGERAEMAARQKELKQQLAEVAGKHEGVLASQADIVEQAREEARQEERALIRHEQEQQEGQPDEQVVALQAELEKLREQASGEIQQERERSTSELAVARDQRAQAKAEIVGLKTQLKQLAQERDTALKGGQALPVASATAADSAKPVEGRRDADSKQLREELEDARMNIEIAVRLRTETEAELAQVTEHRDQLLRQLEAAGAEEAKNPAPAAAKPSKLAAASKRSEAASEAKAEFKYVVDDDSAGKRRWLGAVAGLVVAAIVGLVFWLMLSVQDPMTKFLDLVNMDKARTAWSEFRMPSWLDFATGQGDDVALEEVKAMLSENVEEQPKQAVQTVQAVQTGQAVQAVQAVASSPVDVDPPATPARAVPPPVAELPRALRSFRDALAGGGRGPLMQELPGGSFMMGSAGNSLIFEERPQHRVELARFSIGKYEVTFAEYDRFARATGRRLPYDEKWGRADRPVINVTWKDAQAYARWLSKQTGHRYRLPTEAEWEYAARSGTTTDYWWDRTADTIRANCFNCGSEWDGNSPAPVGNFPANSLGLHDTAGNVQEWTGDCYHPSYQGAPVDGSAREMPGCTQRVIRGGGYTSPKESLRSNKRTHYKEDTRIDNLGFRIVREK